MAKAKATAGAFRGFPREAMAFYVGLEADNSKAYWEAHRAVYLEAVRGPMEALIVSVDRKYQPFKIFRPNRDVRFSKNKSPYKTQTGAWSESPGGGGWYVQLSASGLMSAAGYYVMERDQIARYREAVAGPTGASLARTVAKLEAAGIRVFGGGEAPLKRVPREYPAEHPRGELLKNKGLIAMVEFGDPRWVGTAEVVERLEGFWKTAAPLLTWMDKHVGASRVLPEGAREFVRG